MTRVLIADDQGLVRAGFRLILERNGFDVVGEAQNGVEAVGLAQALSPHVVLMDVRMPELDGIEATRRVLRAAAQARVLMLTTFDLDEYVYDAIRAGASGFLLKDTAPADLVHAVRVVERGEALLAPVITRRLLEQFVSRPPPGSRVPEQLRELTEREIGVLHLVARGLANSEIAKALFLSEATVKTYVTRLLSKLRLRDRVQLVVLAYESGLIQPGEAREHPRMER